MKIIITEKITLIEKVDKYKLQRIIDDFGQNNINEETQNNLKKILWKFR